MLVYHNGRAYKVLAELYWGRTYRVQDILSGRIATYYREELTF